MEGQRAGLVAVRTVHAWTASREEEAWREQVGGQDVSQRRGGRAGRSKVNVQAKCLVIPARLHPHRQQGSLLVPMALGSLPSNV